MPPHARPCDAPKGATPSFGGGVDAFFYVVSCWQSVKNREGLLKLCGFHCIRGGSVPAPVNCQTLGPAMHQRVHRPAWAEARMHFSVSFLVCSVWENALHGYKSGGNAV